jgi:hypothetical protein
MSQPSTAEQNQPQTPSGPQVFLDHVGWMVPDLEACSAAFARLGFPLTPFSVHGDRDPATGANKPIGTANRLAMLRSGYLEFLALHGGVTNPSVERMKASIARHVGVHLCALTVSDAAHEADRLKRDGFVLNPTINLRRTIEAADGSQVEVAFTVIRPEAMPEGRVQMLTQHTPEHMWQPRYIGSANGIDHLAGLLFAVTDPDETARRIGRFADRPPVTVTEELQIRLDRGLLRVTTPARARDILAGATIPSPPAMAAVLFRSDDLGKTRAFLMHAGITPWREEAQRLIIDAKDAMGAYLVVEPV